MRKYLYVLFCIVGVLLWHNNVNGQMLPPSRSGEMAPIVIPALPRTLDFAGEAVPLDNYDTRESLTREMLTTFYLHSRTMQTLIATTRYFPIIEPILKKRGVPDDFKYLCMAESGLNPNARSGAGAAGLWQFMPAVGRSYGLETGSNVDERYHVEMSTEAACSYLLEAKEKLGSWTLAAASYNLGMTGVATRLEKQGVSSYYDAFLPEETLRYVFRILSFKLLTQNPSLYGYIIEPYQYMKPLDDYHEIEISRSNIDWSEVAHENGTTYKMLRELNPWIRSYEYSNKTQKAYVLKIPGKDFRRE